MGAKIFFLLIFALWFLGITGLLLAHFLKKYLLWRQKTPVSPRRQFVLILLPSLLIAFFLCPTLVQTFKDLPVPRGQLKEITAPVESVRQLTYRRTQSRYGGARLEHRYNIYLEDHSGYLRIPENFRFDQEGFLAWAGPEPVTFLYSSDSGRSIPYIIQNASGCFWDYEFAAGQLWHSVMYHLITALSALLFLGAGAVYLPAWLYPLKARGRADKSKKRELAVLFLFIAVLLAITFVQSRPQVTETPAPPPAKMSRSPD